MTRYKFHHLIEELLPVLHVHFQRQRPIKYVLFPVVFDRVQLSASLEALIVTFHRFPLEIVFRIYDSCLANGIEAIFGFSVALLKRNEDALLALKFDAILSLLSNKLVDIYKACVLCF